MSMTEIKAAPFNLHQGWAAENQGAMGCSPLSTTQQKKINPFVSYFAQNSSDTRNYTNGVTVSTGLDIAFGHSPEQRRPHQE